MNTAYMHAHAHTFCTCICRYVRLLSCMSIHVSVCVYVYIHMYTRHACMHDELPAAKLTQIMTQMARMGRAMVKQRKELEEVRVEGPRPYASLGQSHRRSRLPKRSAGPCDPSSPLPTAADLTCSPAVLPCHPAA